MHLSSDHAPIDLDYPDLPSGLDPDQLIAAGQRSLRRRRWIGNSAAIVVLGAGGFAASTLVGQSHPARSLSTRPAASPSESSSFWTDQTDDLTTAHPAVGATETLASIPGRGLTTRAIAYLDAAGNLCAGSGSIDIDAAQYPDMPSNIVAGTCSPSLATVPSGTGWITGAEALELATASPDGDFVVLGFAGRDVADVSVDTRNGTQSARLSATATSAGERAWFVVVPGPALYGNTHQPVTMTQIIAQDAGLKVTATGGSGNVIDSESLMPPPEPTDSQ